MIQKKIQAKIKYKLKKIQARVKGTKLVFLLVNVVDAHQRAGEGGDFPERDEERFMDLAFGVNEDSAEEEDEAAKGQNCGSY